MTLVTVAEFKASPFDFGTWSDSAIEAALEYGERRFYVLTNRIKTGCWLVPTDETHTTHGTGTDLLRLPHPVLTIDEVIVISPTDVEYDITEYVRRAPEGGQYLYYSRGFPVGKYNIRVAGEFGDPELAHDEVPADVKYAVMRLAELKLRRGKVSSERNELFRPNMPGGESIPPPTITGDREVDGIIKSYTLGDLGSSFDFR